MPLNSPTYAKGLITVDVNQKWEQVVKLAKKGDAEAQHTLGVLYSIGLGVSKSHKSAFKWHRKAAKQQHLDSQFCPGGDAPPWTGYPSESP
ncbi:tetratricopeptide repeat protein [Thermodesulfobacteriota bacterium]